MSHLAETEIWSFAAGELSLERERTAAEHLETCTQCRQFLTVVSNFRDHARDLARVPSEFESARMAKQLRVQVQQQTRVQRQAWLPSKVAAAVAFATLSGAAVAMTASGAWPLFSQPEFKGISPLAGAARLAPQQTVDAPVEQIAEESALAVEIATSPQQVIATVPSQDDASAPFNGRGPILEASEEEIARSKIASLSHAGREGAMTEIASASAQPEERVTGRPKRAGPQSDDRAKIAMLPARPLPRTEVPADLRNVEVVPGTPDPMALLKEEEARLMREEAELGWLSVGDAYIQMADTRSALGAYFQSLAGAEGAQAAKRLQSMVSKGLATEDGLVEMLAEHSRAQDSAEGMRLLCEWRLKVQPDRIAVQTCRSFGQAHPAHPAVHRLALAAGLVAENHLGDWDLAVEEYSRALVVSEFAELPSSDALFFRARARARLGQMQEARADLRLFLHVDSSSWNRKEVDDLMRTLNISRE